jgi:hypothetical protein
MLRLTIICLIVGANVENLFRLNWIFETKYLILIDGIWSVLERGHEGLKGQGGHWGLLV